MKKGDQAFFYHSNCKVPGIVGIMEIVQEHSPDGMSTRAPPPPVFLSTTTLTACRRIRVQPRRPLLRRQGHPRQPQVGSRPRRLPPQIPPPRLPPRPESPRGSRTPAGRPADPAPIPPQRLGRHARPMEVYPATGQGKGRRPAGVQRRVRVGGGSITHAPTTPG